MTEHLESIGKYQVLAQLQAGGMAEVFLVCSQGPGGFRKYGVIKRIVPASANDENFVKMFLDEARITAAFSNANIAQVFELGEDETGLFVVMEFIAGANLNEIVSACIQQQAVLPVGFSVSVAHDCALALHYAHTYKTPAGLPSPVIHRDVAQKNIMVTFDGQTKLLDFGIAKAKGALAQTHSGIVKGTTGYMSPEQVRGETLDPRSDVFSLGVVLWEMVTGRRLFSAPTEISEMRMILEAPVPLAHSVEAAVPPSLSQVIDTALRRDKKLRFANARDFAKALAQQHGGFFFDSEARGTFMAERFQERIAASQRLFEAADDGSGSAIFSAAALVAKKTETVKALSDRVQHHSGRFRVDKESVSKPKKKTDPEISLALLKAEAELEALTRKPSPRLPWSLFAVLAAILVLGIGLYVFMSAENSAQNARFEEPSPLDENQPHSSADVSPITPIADTPYAPKVEPAVTEKAPAEPLKQPIETKARAAAKREPKADPKKSEAPKADGQKGKGEITLVLLPDGAAVFEGKQELGKGKLLALTLSVGIHRLVLVAPDGSRHRLALSVVAGRNMPIKANVAELPID
jgi:eukaryotic-like serine/threonine-protein kinase